MKKRNEHKKTNRRGNVKVYFQRWMMLMLTVMVSTTFVGCDIINDPDDPGGTTTGKIDSKLIGYWLNITYSTTGADTHYWYTFKKDGTFEYGTTNRLAEYRGKYSVSNGKIYFSNIIYYYHNLDCDRSKCKVNHETYNRIDVVMEYKFEKDSGIEYLRIFKMSRNHDDSYIDIEGADRFKKT